MTRHLSLTAILLLVASTAAAESWIFRPSAYSHEPSTGVRVAQFMPERQPYYRADSTYMESGYRHQRSAIRGPDGSYDYQHIVQTWGLGELIRPYGEWQFPYRAGATPYGPWGNPSGPWTLPFDSWNNPYGLGKLPTPPWFPWFPTPTPFGPNPGMPGQGNPGHGAMGPGGMGSGMPGGQGPWSGGQTP
jgi:hypothetical protein